MNEKTKNQIVNYLDLANLAVLGIFFLFLPLFFLTTTTDAFVLPKQILLSLAVSISGILFGIRTIIEGTIRLRSTPFDLPIGILAITVLASSIFAVNRNDSFIAFLPFLFATLLYFAIINTIKKEGQLLVVLSSLVLGASLSAIIAFCSFFKIYLLPFPYSQVPYFNTFGSLLDQAIYLALVLPVTGYFVQSVFLSLSSKKKTGAVFSTDKKSNTSSASTVSMAFTVGFVVILAGLLVTVYQLATTQKPLILPLETGIQTAFSTISQDNGRVFYGFLFGSGIGTYSVDFSRFKPVTYNLNPSLWSFTFFRSSTYILELLSTTGILGTLAFIFLIFKIIREKNFFLPLILAIAAFFFLPLSFTIVILFFILIGIFAVIHAHNNPDKFTEVELYFVAFKHGLLATRPEGETVRQNPVQRKYSKLLPTFFFIILLVLVGFPLYLSVRFIISDMYYQSSLVAYSQNNGKLTYDLQVASLNIFPYRDLYYRGLSQTDMALANALAIQARNSSPSAAAQQNILALIQQAISVGKNAATISPMSSFNWSNLSSIYRGLIGFGQNADQFAILTNQQAIILDPKNPQQYIDLGGIYYQIGNYDEAINQFQIAINLKNDYPNAYYNLGHALEMKGDLQRALSAYQVVQTLVANDANNNKKINEDIKALQEKIDNQNKPAPVETAVSTPSATINQAASEPLNINKPDNQLPERQPKAKIPGVSVSLPSPSQPQSTQETSPTPGV